MQWLIAKNLRTAADTEGRLEKHFLPKFGDRLVSGLTKSDLDGWLASMVVESDDPELFDVPKTAPIAFFR